MQRVGLALLCSLVMLLCYGCMHASAKHPGNWPVPELTIPSGATLIESEAPTSAGGQVWTNQYRYSKDAQSFYKHAEKCLKALNFEEYWTDHSNGSPMREMMRTYYSPDHLTKVTVAFVPKDVAARKPDRPNAIIKIELLDEPDECLNTIGSPSSDGTQTRLEPIK